MSVRSSRKTVTFKSPCATAEAAPLPMLALPMHTDAGGGDPGLLDAIRQAQGTPRRPSVNRPPAPSPSLQLEHTNHAHNNT